MQHRISLTALLLTLGLLASGCEDADKPASQPGQFTAEISGSIGGQVSGPGVIRYLPPGDTSIGPRPGYFFIADATGVRDLGITFTIPATARPGTYPLVSAHPMEAGTAFEVRVDRSEGNETVSYQSNTTGTITLEAFPEDGGSTAGSPVEGRFEFTTENTGGKRASAKGTFAFHGR